MAATLRLRFNLPDFWDCLKNATEYFPSNGSIISYWRLLANPHTHPKSGGLPSRHEVVAKVAKEIINVWLKNSIPTISLRSTEKRINVLINQYKSIQKSMKRDAN